MLGSMARDIAAVLEAPGFQEEFESRALLLLAGLLVGAGGGGGAAGQQRQGEEGVLDAALRWLRHAAVRHRVQGSLARWAAGGVGRRVRHIDTGEECTFACRLEGGGGPDSGAAPRTLALVIQTGDSVRVEGAGAAAAGAAAAAALAKRGLTRNELDSLLMAL